MHELIWFLPSLLTYKMILTGISLLIGIAFFSVLAARAETRMWRAIRRSNGERRTLQHHITLGKSHLR